MDGKRKGRLALGCASILALALVPGCSGAEEPQQTKGVPADWYPIAAEELKKSPDPTSETPTISMDSQCLLRPEIKIAGEAARPFGAGSAAWQGSGVLYTCNVTTPSASLTVREQPDAAAFDAWKAKIQPQDSADQQVTDKQITVGNRTIRVIKTGYRANASHIDYIAHYFDSMHKGGVVTLEVETGEYRDLIHTYTEQRAAEDLGAILDGR